MRSQFLLLLLLGTSSLHAADGNLLDKIPADALEPAKTEELDTSSFGSDAFFDSFNDVNGIAAVVADRVITVEEVRKEMAPIIRQIRMRTNSDEAFVKEVQIAEASVLQKLIDEVLILKAFEKKGMKIPQVYADNAYDEHIQEHFNGDRARFIEFLSAQGKTVRQFRKEISENMIISWMRAQKQQSQAEISPEKIEQYYKEHPAQFQLEERAHIQQIALTISREMTESEARDQAQDILRNLKASDDPVAFAQTLENSSDLGWINQSDLYPELANPAFALSSGEFTDIIFINQSLFILVVKEKKSAGIKPIDSVREEIEIILSNEFSRSAIDKWMERLRSEAYIKYYL